MIRSIQNSNNDAVEYMLLGQPQDAVMSLLQALDTWKIRGVSPSSIDSPLCMQIDAGSVTKRQMYSVDLDNEFQPTEPAFPFHWYGKPIAIASGSDCYGYCSEDNDDLPEEEEEALCHDLYVALILYNLGIAYQLEAARQNQELDFVLGRLTSKAAFESYTLALRALLTCQEKMHAPCRSMPVCDHLNSGLLHAAIVNNLLFLYAQNADLQGMTSCLTVLRSILPSVCSGLQGGCSEDFSTFQHNAIVFLTPGSLSLSPAA